MLEPMDYLIKNLLWSKSQGVMAAVNILSQYIIGLAQLQSIIKDILWGHNREL